MNPGRLLLVLSFLFGGLVPTLAQCITDLKKILPERAQNISDNFGNSVATANNYVVVSAFQSDTLGTYLGGVAHVFERVGAGWEHIAMLKPSSSSDYLQFGEHVKIDPSGNTIIVVAYGGNNNKGVYVFEKPATGWEDMSESARFTLDQKAIYSLDFNDDGTKLAIGTPYRDGEPYYHGQVSVFNRPPGGWKDIGAPNVVMDNPEPDGYEFGYSVNFLGSDLVVGAPLTADGYGSIFVMKETGSSYTRVARLTSSLPSGHTNFLGKNISVKGDLIVAPALTYINQVAEAKLFVYKKDGEWKDGVETQQIKIMLDRATASFYPKVAIISEDEIVATALAVEQGYVRRARAMSIKTADPNWSTVTHNILYEQTDLKHGPSDGALATDGTHLVFAQWESNPGSKVLDAVITMTLDGDTWSAPQAITLKTFNSSQFYYGTKVLTHERHLFVGSPFDGVTMSKAGAVYIYDKQGEEMVKIHKLNAPAQFRYDWGFDDGFGYSLAAHNNELAVGAPWFPNQSGWDGKVFVYRRQNSSWNSAVLTDTLEPPQNLEMNYMGYTIAMNDHVLFASAHHSGGTSNSIVIFEKQNGRWKYVQHIDFGTALVRNFPAVSMDLFGDVLAVSVYSFNTPFAMLIDKDSNDQWKIRSTLTLDPAIETNPWGYGGGAIDITENNIFLSYPNATHKGVRWAGVVAIFTKEGGDSWPEGEITTTKFVGATNPVELGLFGSSLKSFGNTLLVGAGGAYQNFDYSLRYTAGHAYLFQTPDFNWDEIVEVKEIQGDGVNQSTKDNFGTSVDIGPESIFIGASYENTTMGSFSGAAYYTAGAPMVKLLSPVCLTSGIVQLEGYPAGGIWTGNGIATGTTTFDPALAGLGMHELTYTAPNCTTPATMRIIVTTGPVAELISPKQIQICPEQKATFQVKPVTGATYSWYFKAVGKDTFIYLDEHEPSIEATLEGEYYATITKLCSSSSPTITLTIEKPLVTLGPQPIICDRTTAVQLVASHTGGTWTGYGNITPQGQLTLGNLSNAEYPVTYHYTSSTGCTFHLKDTVLAATLPILKIESPASNYCVNGNALLFISSPEPFQFTWWRKNNTGQWEKVPGETSAVLAVFEQGFYKASYANSYCERETAPIDVTFTSTFPIQFQPTENELRICEGNSARLQVLSSFSEEIDWYYSSDAIEFERLVSEDDKRTITIDKAGYYKFESTFGFCHYTSVVKQLQVIPADSMWLPNVFTPNDDDKNALFNVETTLETYQLVIVNRYGKIVYESDQSQPFWNGGDNPSGVYYWHIIYRDCENNERVKKGFVHLLR